MKNYFNKEERTTHIVVLAMQKTLSDFSKSDALSEEEKKLLTDSVKKLIKFNAKIFERMGEPYRRKIEKTMEVNHLKLVGKYAVTQDCVSHVATVDLERGLKELQMFNCLDCEKCDYLNCGTYACMIACDIDGKQTNENICPFRM